MAQSLDYLRKITRFGLGSQLGRWAVATANAIDQNTSGNRTLDRLKAAGGEVSLHSGLGRWLILRSQITDGGTQSVAMIQGTLKASAGEQQRSAAFGQWEEDASH